MGRGSVEGVVAQRAWRAAVGSTLGVALSAETGSVATVA